MGGAQELLAHSYRGMALPSTATWSSEWRLKFVAMYTFWVWGMHHHERFLTLMVR